MFKLRINTLKSSNRELNKILRDCHRFAKGKQPDPNSTEILLCFPMNEQHQSIAYRVFAPLLKSDPERILIIIPKQSRQLLSTVKDDAIIAITEPEDIRNEPLLPDSVNERLRNRPISVAVDLNTEYHPYTAAAVLKSGAIKRIGFRSEYSDYFFNIQMSKKTNDPVESSYQNIYKIILDKSAE